MILIRTFLECHSLKPAQSQHVVVNESESCLLSQKKPKLSLADLESAGWRREHTQTEDFEIYWQRCFLDLIREMKMCSLPFVKAEKALILSGGVLLTARLLDCLWRWGAGFQLPVGCTSQHLCLRLAHTPHQHCEKPLLTAPCHTQPSSFKVMAFTSVSLLFISVALYSMSFPLHGSFSCLGSSIMCLLDSSAHIYSLLLIL